MSRFPISFVYLSLLASCDAFTISAPSSQRQATYMQAHGNINDSKDFSRRDFSKWIGGAAVASLLTSNADSALAFPDSSVTVCEAIKTMDFSLPSSYGEIAGAKSGGQSLVESLEPEKEAPIGMSQKKPKKERDPNESSPLGAVLPSMNKSNKKSAPKKSTSTKAEPKEKEEKMPVIETMDLSLPSYSDSTAKKEKGVFSL